ncbi:hypothetical protein RPD_3658 [Rhodopseudomonas palustris BisB5]|uniref:TnsA endonuclease N-terminal domain-containing protein n=1 Tax=Rhodopseudomonas palustris (strain BisB5) TaxID=316057 RepID=Q132V8_RHOPS|nr:hypothetical protein RPD_3658 [Rhodopseudomonas palustris BisB5]
MSIPLKILLSRELELREERTIATIHVSESGGPVRPLITGREPHPTGRPVVVKAAFRALPWESMTGELSLIELAEVSTAVWRFMVQPHRLDMKVTGAKPVISFFPDFEMSVDAGVIDALDQGLPFWRAVMCTRQHTASSDCKTLIVEVKTDADRRLRDAEYRHKLELARELYGKLGWSFTTVVETPDLPTGAVAKAVHAIWTKKMTLVTSTDVGVAAGHIESRSGRSTYDEVAAALGPGPTGRAKLAALHVRRVVQIDLGRGLSGFSDVTMVDDGGAIL